MRRLTELLVELLLTPVIVLGLATFALVDLANFAVRRLRAVRP